MNTDKVELDTKIMYVLGVLSVVGGDVIAWAHGLPSYLRAVAIRTTPRLGHTAIVGGIVVMVAAVAIQRRWGIEEGEHEFTNALEKLGAVALFWGLLFPLVGAVIPPGQAPVVYRGSLLITILGLALGALFGDHSDPASQQGVPDDPTEMLEDDA